MNNSPYRDRIVVIFCEGEIHHDVQATIFEGKIDANVKIDGWLRSFKPFSENNPLDYGFFIEPENIEIAYAYLARKASDLESAIKIKQQELYALEKSMCYTKNWLAVKG